MFQNKTITCVQEYHVEGVRRAFHDEQDGIAVVVRARAPSICNRQCVAVCCSVLQCAGACCNVPNVFLEHRVSKRYCVAACCSVL